MNLKTLAPALELKELDQETGVIKGYGSVFGVVDSHSEIVDAGAFAQSLAEHKKRGTRPKMFWQHSLAEPIGKWTSAVEDGRGLLLEGKINLEVARGREALALLKNEDIDGLSIGYWPREFEPDAKRPSVMRLKRVDLVEVSIVSIGSNPAATVSDAKSAVMDALAASEDMARLKEILAGGELPTARELERGLKVALDLSNTQAERAVSVLLRRSQGDLEAKQDPTSGLKAALSDVSAILAGLK